MSEPKTNSTAIAGSSPVPCSLFLSLIGLVQESITGDWRCSLDYNNYQDGARVLDGDGNVIGECYDLWPEEMGVDEGVAWQFARAIERASSNPENNTDQECEASPASPCSP